MCSVVLDEIVLLFRGYDRLAKQKYQYPEGTEYREEGGIFPCVSKFDVQLGQIWDALQPDNLLLVVTGQGDTAPQRHQEVRHKLFRLCCLVFALKAILGLRSPTSMHFSAINVVHSCFAMHLEIH